MPVVKLGEAMRCASIPRMLVLPLTLLLLLCLSPCGRLTAAEQSSADRPAFTLRPDAPMRHRLAPVKTEPSDNTRLFLLRDLKPHSHYEVRVSFLGTAPFSFQLSLAPSLSLSPTGRRLLDIEKLTLATGADGRVLRDTGQSGSADATSEDAVRLSVSWSGRAPSSAAEAALRSAGVEFIVVCDTLLPLAVPRFAPALLALLAAALLVGLRYVVPLIIAHVRAVDAEAQSELGKRR